MKKYRVTCLNCKESDVLTIDDQNHVLMYNYKGMMGNILTARWRGDEQWGFQCKCGNENRIGAKEADDFDHLAQGDPLSVERIRESMKIPDDKQFKMEAA